MTQPAERLLTVDDFIKMPEYDERYELLDGRLVAKPMPRYKHSLIAARLRDAWKVLDPEEKDGSMLQEVSFKLGLSSGPTPDLSYWTAGHRPDEDVDIAPVPDLTVEVVSPGQAVKTLTNKARRYIQAGVTIAWIILPASKSAIEFRKDRPIPINIPPGGELDGEDVIPGFKFELAKLFG